MAKPKRDVIVRVVVDNANERRTGVIHAWSNDIIPSDAMSVEGVVGISIGRAGPTFVYVDARYDVNEVAVELEELLLAKVPVSTAPKV